MSPLWRWSAGARRPLHGFTFVELLVVMGIIAVLVALVLPALQAARESARRGTCASRIKQLATAVTLYENANSAFPPAVVGSGICSSAPAGVAGFAPPASSYSGTTAILNTSGMVLMLPQLGQQAPYERANLRQSFGTYRDPYFSSSSWSVVATATSNMVASLTRLPTLECPSAFPGNTTNPALPAAYIVSSTAYGQTVLMDTSSNRFISGSNAAGAEYGRSTNYLLASSRESNTVCDGWRKAAQTPGGTRQRYLCGEESFARAANVLDGLSNVFAAYETLSGQPGQPFQGVAWAFYTGAYRGYDSPASAPTPINQWDPAVGPGYLLKLGGGAGSSHPGGCHFAFADGRVQFVNEQVQGAILNALFQTGDNVDSANGLNPVDQLQ